MSQPQRIRPDRPESGEAATAGDAASPPSTRVVTSIRLAKTLGAVGMLALAFPVSTWLMLGAGEAARAATELAMPVGAAWLALFAAGVWCWFGRRPQQAAGCWALWVLAGMLFGQPGAGWLMRLTEMPPQPLVQTVAEPFAAVIVLGGGAGLDPLDRPELGGDGQRIMSAAQLWHAGQTRSIITTGASVVSPSDPAEIARELLESVGVPSSAIFEVSGENTAQEMLSLRAFLETPPEAFRERIGTLVDSSGRPAVDAQQVGLITSAFHMPRAQRLAKSHGLDFPPLPCCFRTGSPNAKFSPREWIPDSDGVMDVTLSLKEWLAWVVGR